MLDKRNYELEYMRELQEKEFYILLDILFSEIPYVETIEKEVKNELLIKGNRNGDYRFKSYHNDIILIHVV